MFNFTKIKFALLVMVASFAALTEPEKSTLTGLLKTKYQIPNEPLPGSTAVSVAAYASDGSLIHSVVGPIDQIYGLAGAFNGAATAAGKTIESYVLIDESNALVLSMENAFCASKNSVVITAEAAVNSALRATSVATGATGEWAFLLP